MFAAIVLLIVAAFLPPRWLTISGYVSSPVRSIIAPAQHGLGQAVTWLRGKTEPSRGLEASPEGAELLRQNDQLLSSFLQSQEEIKSLRRIISEISHSVEINPGQSIRLINAPVIGGPADLTTKSLTIRAGRSNGVEPNAIAVVRGVHIVGKVRTADERLCTVIPFTDASIRPFNAVIMLEPDRRGPVCQLTPDGRGRFTGRVMEDASLRDPATAATTPITIGMMVRLDDADWPRTAKMLIVGQVIGIEPLPNQPLRRVVTVEPYYAPDRATEVMIRSLVVSENSISPKTNEEGVNP